MVVYAVWALYVQCGHRHLAGEEGGGERVRVSVRALPTLLFRAMARQDPSPPTESSASPQSANSCDDHWYFAFYCIAYIAIKGNIYVGDKPQAIYTCHCYHYYELVRCVCGHVGRSVGCGGEGERKRERGT